MKNRVGAVLGLGAVLAVGLGAAPSHVAFTGPLVSMHASSAVVHDRQGYYMISAISGVSPTDATITGQFVYPETRYTFIGGIPLLHAHAAADLDK